MSAGAPGHHRGADAPAEPSTIPPKGTNSQASFVAPALLRPEGMNTTATVARQDPDSYRDSDSLSIDLIRRTLSTRTTGFEIHLHGAVTSTNDVALRLAEEGAREGTVVLAEAQRQGRRRFGRSWFSPERANLYASVIFRPSVSPEAAPAFALIGSLALADALTENGVAAAVRWPNEVVVAGRKIGGTLASVATTGGVVKHLILGVGVNVNVTHAELERALGAPATFATSVREAIGRAIDRNRLAASFLNHLERWHTIYTTRGASAALVAWNQRDVVRGRVVEIREDAGTCRGHVAGVDDAGRLILEQRPGARRVITAGEITAVDGEQTR